MNAPVATGSALRRVSRDEWVELAADYADHNYRHCWDWSSMMAARTGASAELVAIEQDGQPFALASVRVKRLPGVRLGIAYVAGGPLVRQAGAEFPRARLDAALAALAREYAGRRRLVLRVAPTIADPEWMRTQESCFANAGFAPADGLTPYRTMLVDIGRPAAEVRAGLAQKWRNCLNKAERQDIELREGDDPALFEDFGPLFDELVARKAFDAGLGAEFYGELQTKLDASERLFVAIARIGGEPAAGVVASIHGDTCVYLLGAADDAARKANAAYLLQWRAIQAAIERGCRWYDLGGVDQEANPGVYKFKRGMGGVELSAPGPYELAPTALHGRAVHAAERAFRALAARRSR